MKKHIKLLLPAIIATVFILSCSQEVTVDSHLYANTDTTPTPTYVVTPSYTNAINWQNEGLSLPTVTYQGRGTNPPTEPGQYTAIFTLGDQSISVNFTIPEDENE